MRAAAHVTPSLKLFGHWLFMPCNAPQLEVCERPHRPLNSGRPGARGP